MDENFISIILQRSENKIRGIIWAAPSLKYVHMSISQTKKKHKHTHSSYVIYHLFIEPNHGKKNCNNFLQFNQK